MRLLRIISILLLLPAISVRAEDTVGPTAKGYNELGVMAFEAQHYQEAMEHFAQALALDPGNPSIRRNLCSVHQAMADQLADQDKLQDAIAEVLKAVDVFPGNPAPLAQLGAYYLKAGKLEDARARLEAALALDPRNKDARFLLGEVYYEQNKLGDAQRAWEQVLKADPERPGLKEKLAKLAREAGVEQDFNQYEKGHFRLTYAKALSEETRAVVFGALEDAYKELGEALGGIYPADIVQVVLYDEAQFTEATGSPEHVGALYDGKIRSPITGRNGRFLDARVLRVRLRHEYTHVLLVQYVGPKLAWWINEGLAETFSRDMDQVRRRQLRKAEMEEDVAPLRKLEDVHMNDFKPDALTVAYAQAHAAAEYLWNDGGTKKLAPFLKLLRKGTKPEAAMKKIYGLSYDKLEKAVEQGSQ